MTISDDNFQLSNGNEPPQPPDEASPSVQGKENVNPANIPGPKVTRSSSRETTPTDFDFSRMEDDVAAFKRELDALKPPTFEQNFDNEPKELIRQAPRRRRRSGRGMEKFNSSEINSRMEAILQRSAPTVDFFLFAFLSGCILGLGYLLDTPAILLIGIFISPVLGPWVGATLASATGDTSFLRQTLGGMLTAILIIFFTGILAGFLARFFHPATSYQAIYHARLWWPELLMLVIGTVAIIIIYTQSESHPEKKPIIPSLMLAYEIFLPISAAGFGIGSGIKELWPQAGLVFLAHLMLSLIISLLVFFYMGFRPVETNGYALPAIMLVSALIILSGFAGLGNGFTFRAEQAASSTATQTMAPAFTNTSEIIATSITQTLPASTPSKTPLPPTRASSTATKELPPTKALTPESTMVPTPFYGKVQAPSSDGVLVRAKPGNSSTAIGSAQNGYLVEILGDTPIVADGAAWIHVLIEIKAQNRIIDGWVLRDLILTATPSFSP